MRFFKNKEAHSKKKMRKYKIENREQWDDILNMDKIVIPKKIDLDEIRGNGPKFSAFNDKIPETIVPEDSEDSLKGNLQNKKEKEVYFYHLKTNEKIVIQKFPCVIGSDTEGVDICLSDISVSRKHAILRYIQDRFILVDLSSKNGTFLNGTAIVPEREIEIHDNDVIRFSRNEFVFRT